MTNRYAEGTEVSLEQSQREIETLLRRYGASKFAINYETEEIIFEIHGVAGKVSIRKPNINDRDIQKTKTGLQRNRQDIERAYEQKKRQRWRVMLLLLKAALEAVECGVMSVEEALLPHLILRNGQKISEAYLASVSSKIEFLPGKEE